MPPLHLLIKPASGMCNMRCDYCFYHDVVQKREVASHGFMTLDTLESIMKKALEQATGEVTFAYQGGEPTLAGLGFFREAMKIQKKHNCKKLTIHNALQTNGYAIDGEWAEFFAQNRFLIGLSVDGKKDTHDLHRHGPAGEGSFARVANAARLFGQAGVDFNVLTVVNRQTARKAEAIYNFYRKNGWDYMQFIPCLDPLDEIPGGYGHSLRAKDYGQFLMALFDMWHADVARGQRVYIRDFDNYLAMARGHRPEACGLGGHCTHQYVIEADGGVYPCDFYTVDEYRLGNLTKDDFADIEEKRREIGFIEASLRIPDECKTCSVYGMCRGGCRRHRDTNGRNYLCDAYKAFFPYAWDRLAGIKR